MTKSIARPASALGTRSTPVASARPADDPTPVVSLDDRLHDFLARGRRAQAAVDQITAHGPGLTFGELAIGECFDWPVPIPLCTEPLVKTAANRYEWSRGHGTAEDFYRVERWP